MSVLQKMASALGAPLLVAQGYGQTLIIGRWRHGDAEVNVEGNEREAVVVVNLSNCQKVERRCNGVWTRHRSFAIGSHGLVDPELGSLFTIQGHADVLSLHLPREIVAEALGTDRKPRIRARFHEEDVFVERYAMQALVALHNQEINHQLLVTELAHRLAVRLTSTRAANGVRRVKGGLSSKTLSRIRDLINHRLTTQSTSSLTLTALAQAANLSPFHFSREFRNSTGTTPYAFVLERRLEWARSLLANHPVSIADVASSAGFKSSAHFTMLFRRRVGVTPAVLRRALHIGRQG